LKKLKDKYIKLIIFKNFILEVVSEVVSFLKGKKKKRKSANLLRKL
jgi:hypothetical protein